MSTETTTITNPSTDELLGLYTSHDLESGYGVPVAVITKIAAELNPEFYIIETVGNLFARVRSDGTRYFLYREVGSDDELQLTVDSISTIRLTK